MPECSLLLPAGVGTVLSSCTARGVELDLYRLIQNGPSLSCRWAAAVTAGPFGDESSPFHAQRSSPQAWAVAAHILLSHLTIAVGMFAAASSQLQGGSERPARPDGAAQGPHRRPFWPRGPDRRRPLSVRLRTDAFCLVFPCMFQQNHNMGHVSQAVSRLHCGVCGPYAPRTENSNCKFTSERLRPVGAVSAPPPRTVSSIYSAYTGNYMITSLTIPNVQR